LTLSSTDELPLLWHTFESTDWDSGLADPNMSVILYDPQMCIANSVCLSREICDEHNAGFVEVASSVSEITTLLQAKHGSCATFPPSTTVTLQIPYEVARLSNGVAVCNGGQWNVSSTMEDTSVQLKVGETSFAVVNLTTPREHETADLFSPLPVGLQPYVDFLKNLLEVNSAASAGHVLLGTHSTVADVVVSNSDTTGLALKSLIRRVIQDISDIYPATIGHLFGDQYNDHSVKPLCHRTVTSAHHISGGVPPLRH
jgi:hypothetical protein